MTSIRRMEEKDIEKAARLEAENFSSPWSKHAFAETLRCGYAFYYVAEADADIIGICGLRNIAGEGEITNVSVDHRHRREGVAAALLAKALEDGGKMGIEAFTLEVRSGNRPAICLYEKFGFKNAGIRKNFYDNPKEDAVIMWKRQEEDGRITTVFTP